jgi:hypothetical protein
MNEEMKQIQLQLQILNHKFNSPYGLIIARKYKINKVEYINCFDKVGVLSLDNSFKVMTKKTKNPTSLPDIVYLTEQHYAMLKEKQIDTFTDPRFKSSLFNLQEQHAKIVDAIIRVQNSSEKIIPTKISFPKSAKRELYVDFETIGENITDPLESSICNRETFLFFIGMGYTNEDNEWNYTHFRMNSLTREEEYRVCLEFKKFVESTPSVLYHWTRAEVTFLNKTLQKYNLQWTPNWFDVYQYFVETPIAIKNCYNYSLKSVAKAMYEHGYIQTIWNQDMFDGLECSARAFNMYKYNHQKDLPNIIRYNEIDCKVIFEILQYFRR